jgi:uncharacterized protein YcfL
MKDKFLLFIFLLLLLGCKDSQHPSVLWVHKENGKVTATKGYLYGKAGDFSEIHYCAGWYCDVQFVKPDENDQIEIFKEVSK